MIVVSDTSPVTNLIECGLLHLLPAVYGEVIMPEAVRDELAQLVPLNSAYDMAMHSWVDVRRVSGRHEIGALLRRGLDPGEAEAIVLAQELAADLLLIDERHGAAVADELGLQHVGVLGVLIAAKRRNLIPQVSSIVAKLRDEVGFWLSDDVVRHVLLLAGEGGE